jgi:4-hydroxy-4-methyl-2-oxoglutarate aldolase
MINMAEPNIAIDAMAERFRRIPTATIFDTLDRMGKPDTVLSLGIKPLRHDMRMAGPAFTVKGTRDPRHHDEEPDVRPAKFDNWGMYRAMYPGCVVLIDGGPDEHCGLTGEMMSYQSKQHGARGVVVDGGIRDGPGLLLIPDWPVFVRYTSPIESARRYCYVDFEVSIYLSGTLSRYVRVNPGDWIVGDMDGVIVIAKEIAADVLVQAEEVNQREAATREDLRAGVPFDEVYRRYRRG